MSGVKKGMQTNMHPQKDMPADTTLVGNWNTNFIRRPTAVTKQETSYDFSNM